MPGGERSSESKNAILFSCAGAVIQYALRYADPNFFLSITMLLWKTFCLEVSRRVISRIIRARDPRDLRLTFSMISRPVTEPPDTPRGHNAAIAMSAEVNAMTPYNPNRRTVKFTISEGLPLGELAARARLGGQRPLWWRHRKSRTELHNADGTRSMPPRKGRVDPGWRRVSNAYSGSIDRKQPLSPDKIYQSSDLE